MVLIVVKMFGTFGEKNILFADVEVHIAEDLILMKKHYMQGFYMQQI